MSGDRLQETGIRKVNCRQAVNRLSPDTWSLDGGVAQLGERLPCTQEVIGSIPFTSTIFMVVFVVDLLSVVKPESFVLLGFLAFNKGH